MTVRSHTVTDVGVGAGVGADADALAAGLGSLRERASAAATAPNAPRVRGRWRMALVERLPVWVQLRCGIEPRTLAALTVVLVVSAVFATYHFWAGRPQTIRAPAREAQVATAAPTAAAAVPSGASGAPPPGGRASARDVVVDVAGKVLRPGVRHLPAGSRVADALEAAGGARPGADTTGLNRARLLMDGEQIVVGLPAPSAPVGSSNGVGGASNSALGVSQEPGGPVQGSAGPLSLNSATLEQLDGLPGVGPVLAQHILDYRAQHGGFRSVSDLRHVNGIGARRFTDLKPLVRP
ncbi:helix-hairpin-helix domain-containing protein [Streptomyces sp. NPDC053048]|uniref:helix-hairpin-helix domain-containing protein n=1 Tax=Streptomyces sp. NPDC053048 TaxID=3365694 RepID=UPI0037D730D2